LCFTHRTLQSADLVFFSFFIHLAHHVA
jgi:hypothetical protein